MITGIQSEDFEICLAAHAYMLICGNGPVCLPPSRISISRHGSCELHMYKKTLLEIRSVDVIELFTDCAQIDNLTF